MGIGIEMGGRNKPLHGNPEYSCQSKETGGHLAWAHHLLLGLLVDARHVRIGALVQHCNYPIGRRGIDDGTSNHLQAQK